MIPAAPTRSRSPPPSAIGAESLLPVAASAAGAAVQTCANTTCVPAASYTFSWMNAPRPTTPAAKASLEKELTDLEKATGWEIAVVTVPNMEGGTVERYAQDLFTSYGIGKKGTDNGVLLLVAREERKLRIHTGYHADSIVTGRVREARPAASNPYGSLRHEP